MSRAVKTFSILQPHSSEPGALAALGEFSEADAPEAAWPRVRPDRSHRVWVAPSRNFEHRLARFLAGEQGIAMVPADTAAPWWYRAIYGRASAITYTACDMGHGRPRQVALVAFGNREATRLVRSHIGPTVRLRHA